MLWLLCAAAAGAALHTNAYTSAPPAVRNGRFPIAAETATIRHAQEFIVSVPIQRGIHLVSGEFQNAVTIVPSTVTVIGSHRTLKIAPIRPGLRLGWRTQT